MGQSARLPCDEADRLNVLPTRASERVRRKAGDRLDAALSPLVTAVQEHRRRVIAAADETASRLGIAPGIAKLLSQRIETVDPGIGVEAMKLVASLKADI